MVKIIFLIILGLHFLFGFILYGVGLAQLKRENDKELLSLGLSKEALEFKPCLDHNDPIFKIFTFFVCLLFGTFYALKSIIVDVFPFKLDDFKRFKLW